jgi:hypothetical protein
MKDITAEEIAEVKRFFLISLGTQMSVDLNLILGSQQNIKHKVDIAHSQQRKNFGRQQFKVY